MTIGTVGLLLGYCRATVGLLSELSELSELSDGHPTVDAHGVTHSLSEKTVGHCRATVGTVGTVGNRRELSGTVGNCRATVGTVGTGLRSGAVRS